MQSAKAAAQADAFTAQADDPSAIFYNPAGLTQLRGTNISGGLFFLQPEYNFNGDNGTNQSMNLPSLLPHVFVASDLGTERFRVGLGIANTFGLNEDYGNTGPLRFLVDNAQLMVLNIAPTVAYKFNDHFSAGLAFNIYYGDIMLTRNVPLGAPPTPEGSFHFRGDDVAFGVTPGFMYKINDHHTIGAYYRSPFQLNFDGKAEVKTPGPTIGPSDTSASLRFPQSFGLGYAWRPNNHWTLEGDVIWTDWHAVKQFTLSSSNPAFNGQTLPANWNSGWTFRLGTQYAFNEHWAIRGGYAYGQNAVPAETFGPLVPDSNYHLFALGFGYSADRWGIDVAGNYIYRETHHVSGSVNSPTVDGLWENAMVGVMATLTVKL
jgi:long-chain fatty acid transport protein